MSSRFYQASHVQQQQQHVNDLSKHVPHSTMADVPNSPLTLDEPTLSLLAAILRPQNLDAKTFKHDPYQQAKVFHQALVNIVPAYPVALLIAEGRKYQEKHPCAPNTQTLFVGEMPLCWNNKQELIDILCGIISVLGLDVTVSNAHMCEKFNHYNGCAHFTVSDLNVLLQYLNSSVLAEPEYVFIAQTPEQKATLHDHAEKFKNQVQAACLAHLAQTKKKLRLPTPRNVMSFEGPKSRSPVLAVPYGLAN